MPLIVLQLDSHRPVTSAGPARTSLPASTNSIDSQLESRQDDKVTTRGTTPGTARRGGVRGGRVVRPARLFGLAVPGLAPLLGRELESIDGVQVSGRGFDGRSDVVVFTAEHRAVGQLKGLRLAEDLFVEVGRTLRAEGDRAPWIAGRLLTPERTRRALALRGQILPQARREQASYRVIVRVLQERSFLRTELRRHLSAIVANQQPRWHFADPSDLELWVVEYQPGKIIAGVRTSDARMRQHEGRAQERPGALRPTVAAAMVALAGRPDRGLLDPCCGSGTILKEALRVGWTDVHGVDIDPTAIDVARRNVGGARLTVGDARTLDADANTMAACVANLPFGQQYDVEGDLDDWLRAVLSEMARATRLGGRVVLLAPRTTRSVVPAALHLVERIPIVLLGTRCVLWRYDRT
jgi:hypothetical protein